MRAMSIPVLVLAAACAHAADVTPYKDIFRLPIPDRLPAHPRLFCTQADLDRVRADLAKGDPYTRLCVDHIVSVGEARLAGMAGLKAQQAGRVHASAASALAEAYAVTGEERFGTACRDLLLLMADAYPKLNTTRARGRFTDSTLSEGPVAIKCANAYDLVAGAAFMKPDNRGRIERDLLRTMAWECGHRCGHRNSSNWRTWALTIVASCGFAIGDRGLMEEAINGVYDESRRAYLYGAVQQLTHSVFSDGIHWERSMGYTYYTSSALMYVMMAANNSGIDLWHAKLPGILGPFQGCAPHREFGPPGDRSIRALLDGPFYYAFPNGSFARVGDSGTKQLAYHRIYELAYAEYRDPKYAWLISRQRAGGAADPAGWQVWRPKGDPRDEALAAGGWQGGSAYRLQTGDGDRIGLVQNVRVLADQPTRVRGRVKALKMAGGSAHIRCNTGDKALFTNRVRKAGGWCDAEVVIPATPGAARGSYRNVRLHVFLEGGAGEVIWDDIRVTSGDGAANRVINGHFGAGSTDGRRLDFWSLVHSPKDVPAGRYSLADDATIGISGRHGNGCTLFPVGGFAVLRSDATDVNATALNFAFGPYGSGHDHPDRLHVSIYGLGGVLCPDAGSWGYSNPMHLTWANQTIAHNTVTVDELSQWPQGKSDGIWASERDNRESFGVLRCFYSGRRLKAVRATCDTAYPGVTLDRTLCLVSPYVLDVFRVRSADAHTYDYALHVKGAASAATPLAALESNPFQARGYSHLTQVRRAAPAAGSLRVDFRDRDRSVMLLHDQPAGGEVLLAKDPKRDMDTSAFIARRRGRHTDYVSVIEPHAGEPTVSSLVVEGGDRGMVVVVRHAGGEDRFELPASFGEAIRFRSDGREDLAEPWQE